MVDCDLTEEQLLMREMAHDFAGNEIRPRAWEYDRDGTWLEDILVKARGVGLVNSHVPPEYGGAGASYLEGSVIVEELAWGCAAIATTLGANDLASAPVLLGGSEATKSTYGGGSSQHGAVDGFGAQAS